MKWRWVSRAAVVSRAALWTFASRVSVISTHAVRTEDTTATLSQRRTEGAGGTFARRQHRSASS
jgi:hypothetical protein